MFVTQIKCWPLLLVFSYVLGINSAAYAVGWSDDFSDGSATDGNPVSWLEDLGGIGFFPGIYSASTVDYPGDYVLDPDAGPLGFVSVTFVPTVNFSDTYIRARVLLSPTRIIRPILVMAATSPSSHASIRVALIRTSSMLTLMMAVAGLFNCSMPLAVTQPIFRIPRLIPCLSLNWPPAVIAKSSSN